MSDDSEVDRSVSETSSEPKPTETDAPESADVPDRDERRAAAESATGSGSAPATDDRKPTSRTPCPRCGTPIGTVTSRGPHDHRASPCGCRVSGNVLESSD